MNAPLLPGRNAGEALGGGGLRRIDGTVLAKTGTGNAIQNYKIPDSLLRIMRHKGRPGAAGSHPAVFPAALLDSVLVSLRLGGLLHVPKVGSADGAAVCNFLGFKTNPLDSSSVF